MDKENDPLFVRGWLVGWRGPMLVTKSSPEFLKEVDKYRWVN